ncbi:SDR family oxidoreductase [Pedobacter jamesrossensis]|uniref:SDR family oxidoreductase n=1 Tax=Pedobacter jamesrossensis TaxID=1908238 RepID=A0ABV8NL37_9SPHI
MNRLKNKVTVITGGNSGIGYGIAESFKNEGAVGTVTGRNLDTLNQATQLLGGNFLGIKGDVTSIADLANIFRKTNEKYGKIDALVVNAGGAVDGHAMGTIDTVTEENYDAWMNLNLKSVYFTVQKALPYMNDGASIILIGSTAAHLASPGMAIYGAAKAAVIYLAKGLSLDLLSRKIRVNVVSPGSIDTPVFGKLVPAEEIEQVKKYWADITPVGRQGSPADIGSAVVFLASEDSAFIVGTEILSDGGFTSMSLMK